MKKILCITAALAIFAGPEAEAAGDSTEVAINYIPTFHATLKPRYELDADNGEGRFQVRNARFGAIGELTKQFHYKLEVDFCDRGKIKVLDAYAGLKFAKGFDLQLGQIRIPFGIDAPRANYDYIFADYSFVGRFTGAIRACGVKLTYNVPKTRLTLAGSVFNTYEMTEQTKWQKSMSYAVEARYKLGAFTPVVGFESNLPDGIRINNLDAALLFREGRWEAEGEYLMKHYTHDAYKTAHAWNVLTRYTMPVKTDFFNRLTFQARYDGMTNYSNGMKNDAGLLTTSEGRCNRVSVGTTIGHVKLPIIAYLRLDYYHTFRPSGQTTPPGEGNKLIAEFVVHF